jgi:hypothetical protein
MLLNGSAVYDVYGFLMIAMVENTYYENTKQ